MDITGIEITVDHHIKSPALQRVHRKLCTKIIGAVADAVVNETAAVLSSLEIAADIAKAGNAKGGAE